MKTSMFPANSVELILDTIEIEEMAASAAISLNPHVTWLKIVLTDDMPNANRQKIPRKEFANVLRTGVFMPLKMGYGEITEGHENVFPIGTFAHLKTEANTVEALVALWNRERKEDVEILKERYADGKPIDVSWEVTYTDEELDELDGSSALRNISMNGACIVGMPAYQGRTTVTGMSSSSVTTESSNEEGESSNMDEEKYTQQIKELETEVEGLKTKLSTSEAELNKIKPEYETLADFKQKYDAEQDRLTKIKRIKDKFSEADLKIEDEDKYIDEKLDMFLAMSDEQFDFFVQELSAFSATNEDNGGDEEGKASVSLTSNLPPVRTQSASRVGTKELVDYLRKTK